MKNRIPVRKFGKVKLANDHNLGGFLNTFLFTYSGVNEEGLYTVIQSKINIFAVCFLNLLVLIKTEEYGGCLSPQKKQLYRYGIAYALTLLYSFCVNPVRGIFADETWRVITTRQRLITTIVGCLGVDVLVFTMHNLVIAYQAKSDAEI